MLSQYQLNEPCRVRLFKKISAKKPSLYQATIYSLSFFSVGGKSFLQCPGHGTPCPYIFIFECRGTARCALATLLEFLSPTELFLINRTATLMTSVVFGHARSTHEKENDLSIFISKPSC